MPKRMWVHLNLYFMATILMLWQEEVLVTYKSIKSTPGRPQKCQSRVSQLRFKLGTFKQRSEIEAPCSGFIVPWFHVCPCKNTKYIPPILSDPLHLLWTANVFKYHRECTLCRTKIHWPDISYIPLRQSHDVQLPS